jgi:homoserine kinase
MDTKGQDALAILKLYELRGEALMREARRWFFSEFAPQSGKDVVRLMLSGEKESAYYRMVASHWDVAAALVLGGGIDEQLFLESNSEHVVVFAKLQPLLAEIRETMGEPDYMIHLEQLVMKVPNIEKKLENRRRLLARWTQPKASAAEQT